MQIVALESGHPGAASGSDPDVAPALAQTLSVTAFYVLSETGRKAALLAGRDSRARQSIRVDVPLARLHLVAVDPSGTARLKLRPRYERNSDQAILRVDEPPVFDIPPTLDDLFGLAARNYELGRIYHAERELLRTQRSNAEQDLRVAAAQAFLSDPSARATAHPAPTPRHCRLRTDRGHRTFDVRTDQGLAKEVPPEAHRRFRADLRTKRDANRQVRGEQLALHDIKKQAVALWIQDHGTSEQQARQEAGMLSLAEAVELMTDRSFAALHGQPRYERDGLERLQASLRRSPEHAAVVLTSRELTITSAEATAATQSQWALLERIREAVPGAAVTLRSHRLAWTKDPRAATLTVYSILIARREGLFSLRREYAAPD